MRDDLSKHVYYNGPTVFTPEEIAEEPDLFANRAALFFTPTHNIPDEFVGSGPLTVRLPLAPPTIYEFNEIWGLRSPRMWVDLFQRATGKVRWRPMNPARVEISCFDSYRWGGNRIGHKALVDALKRATTGRSDKRLLHYFGAIEDDGPGFIQHSEFGFVREQLIENPADAHTLVKVVPV